MSPADLNRQAGHFLYSENLTCQIGHKFLSFPNFNLHNNEIVLLTGPSGSGKTTLLTMIAGLRSYTEGTLLLDGQTWQQIPHNQRDQRRGRLIGYIPQQPLLLPNLNVYENLALVAYLTKRVLATEMADEILEKLGLQGLGSRMPRDLSRGEQQRVAVARALVNQPKILLADEPSANLDDVAAASMLDLLMDVCKQISSAMIIATHDSRIKQRISRTIVL